MSRSGALIKNTIIFAIGNIGSKLIQFLLLPFYTHVLTDAQYGIINNLQNVSTILIPVLSLSIFEGVFRYAMDSNTKKEDAFSTGINVTVIAAVVAAVVGGAMYSLGIFREYILAVILYTISNIFYTVATQFVRAVDRVKLYAVVNIIHTLLIMLFNMLFLVVVPGQKPIDGINGYMMSYTLSNVISFVLVFVVAKLWKSYRIRNVSMTTVKDMLKFSVPLIPNAICWWLSATIGNFMITASLGEEANGVYAVASKIPSIITVIVGIFIQAWQISANTEIGHCDFDQYNSKAFDFLQTLSFILSGFLALTCRIIVLVLGADFRVAWLYMPVMVLAISFFTFSQFLGSLYTASKKTIMAFVSNLVTAVVNVVLNFILLPVMGVMGAAVSLLISYVVFWVFRVINTRPIAKIKYSWGILGYNVIAVACICVFVTLELPFWEVIGTGIFLSMFVINRKNIFAILNMGKGYLLSILGRK